MESEIPPVVPCEYDGSRCAYEGLHADRPCWGDVMAPNDDLLHTCEGHWDDGTYEAFEAAKHRPPPVDRHAQAREALAARIRRENDMPTAKIGDPFAPRAHSPAPAANVNADAMTALGEQWIAELPPDQRALLDRLVQRLRAAPAPAWTHGAPASEGCFWARAPRRPDGCANRGDPTVRSEPLRAVLR